MDDDEWDIFCQDNSRAFGLIGSKPEDFSWIVGKWCGLEYEEYFSFKTKAEAEEKLKEIKKGHPKVAP